ncbi:hypothetical protein [Asaia astilbis]|uniref:hypothetical protein n=1 Tax=Asaia astilbis TaxID=610244 RepID=UPI0004718892|nr:hypothetical protein [Asaia astilbis]
MANLPDGVTDADTDRVFNFMTDDVLEEISGLERAQKALRMAHSAFLALERNSRSNTHDDVLNMLEGSIMPHVDFCLRQHGVEQRRAA